MHGNRTGQTLCLEISGMFYESEECKTAIQSTISGRTTALPVFWECNRVVLYYALLRMTISNAGGQTTCVSYLAPLLTLCTLYPFLRVYYLVICISIWIGSIKPSSTSFDGTSTPSSSLSAWSRSPLLIRRCQTLFTAQLAIFKANEQYYVSIFQIPSRSPFPLPSPFVAGQIKEFQRASCSSLKPLWKQTLWST